MGIDSHGFVQLPQYVRFLRSGAYNPRARITVLRETSSVALIEGGEGLGQVVGVRAMEMAIRKADQTGIGLVGILKCGHLGALVHYTMMALERNMIGGAICTGGLGVAPFGGYQRVLGINPISIAIPGEPDRPVLMDFALSQCSAGKISMALRTGKRLPEGFIVDSKGQPTTDPRAYFDAGSILPFGGHKGYALCLAADLLAGALTGQAFGLKGDWARTGAQGALMMAISISTFTSIDSFKERVDAHLQDIKSSAKADGVDEIVIPGEPEFREREKRVHSGIFLDEKSFQEISSLLKELGLDSRLV
jgi:LDH2 family malate/lactate/ureidoglycolate dehydrogenase